MEQKLEGKDILGLKDMSREEIEYVFEIAKKMEPLARSRSDILRDKVLAVLFWQPSTRTRLSHEVAMLRLGGSVTGWASAGSSRAGDWMRETLKDTAAMIQSYADVCVMRHFQEGAVGEFAKYADIPVINAGDGSGEHPTQGLLDLYTVLKERGKLDGLKVLLMGALWDRVFHSFGYGLSKFDDVELYLLAPKEMRYPKFDRTLKSLGQRFEYVDKIEDVIKGIDVINIVFSGMITTTTTDLKQSGLNWTSIKRSSSPKYVITKDKLKEAKKDLVLLHCLPRMDEVTLDVDNTPYAKYLTAQPLNGLIVRMALLASILGRAPK